MSKPSNPENNPVSTPNSGKSEPEAKKDVHGVERPTEVGGQKGPEPTRYGDWEKNGRCTDF